jgi:hypothetical protein
MLIMAIEPTLTANSIIPSISLCIPPIVAMQRLGKVCLSIHW